MRIPRATYRIQFSPSFGFNDAEKIIPYLAALGISDIYASPIFKARKGSLHGYDVVDPTQLNSELGAVYHFEKLSEELKTHGMGWLQDVVPNHMAFNQENYMLMDVLENGHGSEYSQFFDIDWNHPYEGIKGRLLAPFLGSFYGESLEEGEITLRYGHSGFTLNYYGLVLPLKIESYVHLLTYQLSGLRRKLGGDHPDFIKLLGILYVLKTLASREETEERQEQAKFVKTTLWELYRENSEINGFIDQNIGIFNGKKGNPESFSLLDDLLSDQLFRLSFWKVATEEINYRRFFNINELISLRVEDQEVFNQTHCLLLKLIEEQRITGLRIDHIDGLYDPTQYLERLREKVGKTYIVVEKILGSEEELPSFWPVQGTTGYEFLNHVNGVFCKRQNEKSFNRIYSAITGFKPAYDDLVCEKKRLIMGRHMAGDIDNLAHLLKAASSTDRHGSDITIYGLKRALVEVMAQFPVYRTYISDEVSTERDHVYVVKAVEGAIQSNPALLKELRFIERFLLPKFDDSVSREQRDQRMHFTMRFQQFTGPLMAKGFEDTTLYVYNRLLSLNEVGGNPSRFGISIDELHRFNEQRANLWPHSLNATATHDTKRGEDIRARLSVLSEIPKEWEKNVRKWSRINRPRKRQVKGRRVPDSNDEYFLYQTLVGAFPFDERDYLPFVDRMKEYIIKAVREAKVHTAWLKPDTDYEDAFVAFVEEILDPTEGNPFLDEFLPFQKKVSYYGMFNSLSQTLIKITSPGVPDFYQGTELWDLNLVDPDNRRPVDFDMRRAFLSDIRARCRSEILSLIKELLCRKEDGRVKLFLTNRALLLRREYSEVFQKGAYGPIRSAGKCRDHVIAFARNHRDKWALTVAPRFLTALTDERESPLGQRVWHDTHISLPGGVPQLWKNAITNQLIKGGDRLIMGEVLEHFPVALLISEENK